MVDSAVAPGVQSGRWVGVVVGVYDRGRRDTFGYGRVASGGPVPEATTVFEIGSITKTFTAAVLAAAVREGRARLDEPLRDLLPGGLSYPSYQGQDLTLLQLADHTSGLPRLPDDLETIPGYVAADPYAGYDEAALYAFLERHRLARAPGTKYEYSNLGYGLLGHALALRLQTSWEEAVRSRVAGPLALRDTLGVLDAPRRERQAAGHDAKGRPVPGWTWQALAGAGALHSTVDDLLTYAAAALGHGPAPVAEDLASCLAPRYAPPGTGFQVGLAWMRQPFASGRFSAAEHDGGTGGYASYLGLLPERDAAVVVLTNTDSEVVTPGRAVLEWVAVR
jgi:CubicO group peptidase (beta-lactamase class C family)